MLSLRAKWEIAGAGAALLGILLVAGALREARQDAAELKATLASQQVVVADATKLETSRDDQAKATVETIEKAEKAVQTPTQAIRAIRASIPLPVPIALEPASPSATATAPGALPDAPVANLPVQDLKALADFGAACQVCKVQLAAAQADKADDAVKLAAVTKERDAAVTVAKGGSKWQHIKRAAKWTAIGLGVGAVAGVAATCGSGHCK
jgi:hypothetical protein